jgi:hypothetical protein
MLAIDVAYEIQCKFTFLYTFVWPEVARLGDIVQKYFRMRLNMISL